MANNSIITGADCDEFEMLKNLTEGDKVYTGGYEYNAETDEGGIVIQEFCFRKYTESKNHTEVPFKEGYIPAIIYDPKYPKVDIPQDLSTSYYLSPKAAVLSFKEALEEMTKACNDWLISNK